MEGPAPNDWCSACHDTFHIPFQGNCSHWYCGSCILQVWDYGSAMQPCKCPLCRRQITLLVPSEASSKQRHNAEVSEILRKVEAYNCLFGSQSRGLGQKFQDLPFLLRRLLREMMNPQRSLPFVIRARIYLAVKFILCQHDVFAFELACVKTIPAIGQMFSCVSCVLIFSTAIYVLSPVDIIPEGVISATIFGVFGLLDDLIIALIFFIHIGALYRSILVGHHSGS